MKTKRTIVITTVCIVTLVVIFAGLMYSGFFFSPGNIRARAVDTYATAESVDSLSGAMNGFSFEMYNELGINSDENVFFSPYSIFVALAMTYEGAHGDTAMQMKNVLGFEQNDEVSLCSFGRIYNLFNTVPYCQAKLYKQCFRIGLLVKGNAF